MKTLVIALTDLANDDLVIVSYRSPRGGRTHVAHKIELGDTPQSVVERLASEINRCWMAESFQARSTEKGLIVNCGDAVSDVTFSVEVEGDGATKAELTEF